MEHRSIRRGAVAPAAGTVLAIVAASARAQDEAWRVFGPNQADRMGLRVFPVGDVNNDGFVDVVTTISESDQNAHNCGAVRMLSGQDGSTLWTVYGDSVDDVFGFGLGACADVEGDGIPEVVAGALQANGNGYVKLLAGVSGKLLGSKHFGDSLFDRFGAAVAGTGDVDGDGIADYVVGAPEDDNTGSNSGAIRIFSGATSASLRTIDGPGRSNANFGIAVADLGDVDGDGFPDLAIGENGFVDVMQSNTGSLIYRRKGDPNNPDLFGIAIANLGDLDSDGIADFIVGAPNGIPTGGGYGLAYVYSGASGALLMTEERLVGLDHFGTSVGACGDVDADGVPDFVVGAIPTNALSYAAIFSGRTSRLLYQLWADDFGIEFGIAVGAAGDVDHDGFADVLVGARGDFDRQGQEGSVSAFLGNDLFLQAVPPVAYQGTQVSLQVRDGPPAVLAGIYLVDLNGMPLFNQIAFFVLDGFGEGSFSAVIPPGVVDVDCFFRAYAMSPAGITHMPTVSHDEELSLR